MALVWGCSDSSTTVADAGPVQGPDCGPTLQPYKTACIPVLDECPDHHVPIPGGGCKRVGVEECKVDGAPGLRTPPDWTCKRIGPPTKCLPGWEKTEDGWCEPVLPNRECTAGLMPVIGQSTCQPVGDCGSGTWGKIATDPATIYVDGAYAGTISDGSQANPFTTIGQALAAAPAGAHIAVAAGEYQEDLLLDKPLVLEGICPEKVKVIGQSSDDAGAVTIDTASGEATLREVAVTGPARPWGTCATRR